jgi:uncharacterized UBP type Zn finger protein
MASWKIFGIENAGNFCFLNAAVQALENAGVSVIAGAEVVSKQKYPIIRISALNKLIASKMSAERQNDAHEAYLVLQDKLKLSSCEFEEGIETKCGACERSRFSVIENNHISISICWEKSIGEMLATYLSPMKIESAVCENCRHSELLQCHMLKSFPRVLVIHLKNANSGANPHIDEVIQIQSKTKSDVYELNSVVVYSGNSTSGHYYAIAKKEGKYIMISDAQISELKAIEFPKGHRAYMCFYLKV